jgi:hypothetical protein
VGRDITSYHREGTHNSSSANPDCSFGSSGDHAAGAYISVFLNNHTARSAQVRHDDGSDTNLNVIANLDTFRMVILQVNSIANEHIFPNANSSPPVQSHTQSGPGHESSQEVQRPVQQLSHFFKIVAAELTRL